MKLTENIGVKIPLLANSLCYPRIKQETNVLGNTNTLLILSHAEVRVTHSKIQTLRY